MAMKLARAGHIDACIAAEVALDGYLREQYWDLLRGEDVAIDWHDDGSCNTALVLGRRHRGESAKTGQEQGAAVESPLLRRAFWPSAHEMPRHMSGSSRCARISSGDVGARQRSPSTSRGFLPLTA